MAKTKALQDAEKKIDEALRSGATELDLSYEWAANDSEKLTELPESLGQLTQLQTLNLFGNPLQTLPSWFCNLSQLTELQIGGIGIAELFSQSFAGCVAS